MTLIEFLKDKKIDGNVYLIHYFHLTNKEKCKILGITNSTLNKRELYLVENNVKDVIDTNNIPDYIYNNLNVDLLFKVWLLYKNNIVLNKDIVKHLGVSRNETNTAAVNRALEVIRENEGIVTEVASEKLDREEIVKLLLKNWKK